MCHLKEGIFLRMACEYEDVVAHPNAIVFACKPCLEARGLTAASLDERARLGGMNDLHAVAKQPEAKVVNF